MKVALLLIFLESSHKFISLKFIITFGTRWNENQKTRIAPEMSDKTS